MNDRAPLRQRIRPVLEGRSSHPLAPLRHALRPFSLLWNGAARLRGALYDRGVLTVHRVGAPVISIGNIAAGGTGKTPLVAWLAGELARLGRRAGILSRGYGEHQRAGLNGEAAMLADLAPEALLACNPDRVAGANEALRRGADALILDDGFQHRRIHRDLDLVCLDAASPWSGGACLPEGLLREAPAALARAHALVLSRCERADPPALDATAKALARLAPDALLVQSRTQARDLLGPDRQSDSPEWLRGRRVWALSSIARPDRFHATLRDCGACLAGATVLADHAEHDPASLRAFLRNAVDAGAEALLTTQKDWVKLPAEIARQQVLPVRCLRIGPDLGADGERLLALVRDALGAHPRRA